MKKKITIPAEQQAALVKVLQQDPIIGRGQLAQRLGMRFGGSRDLYEVLGWPQQISFNDLFQRYERGDISRRVVNAYPDATWRVPPFVYEDPDTDVETPFELKYNELVKNVKLQLYSTLMRLDRLACLGEYSVLLLGLDDGGTPDQEVKTARELLFLQPVYQGGAEIAAWEQDVKNERFNMPTFYNITLSRPDGQMSRTIRVHHSRVLHVAHDTITTSLFGTPIMKPVYNLLLNLETLLGGGAEMFWQGGNPGTAFVMDDDARIGADDKAAMQDELTKYYHRLQRYLRLRGVTPHQLSPNISDPSNLVATTIRVIAAATGIPERILTGSERGELASTMDQENWDGRIRERREQFATPVIMKAFVDKLIDLKVLPKPKDVQIGWEKADTLTPSAKVGVESQRVETMSKWLQTPGLSDVLPLDMMLERVYELQPDEIEALVADAEQRQAEEAERAALAGISEEGADGETGDEGDSDKPDDDSDDTTEDDDSDAPRPKDNGGIGSGNFGHSGGEGGPGNPGGSGGSGGASLDSIKPTESDLGFGSKTPSDVPNSKDYSRSVKYKGQEIGKVKSRWDLVKPEGSGGRLRTKLAWRHSIELDDQKIETVMGFRPGFASTASDYGFTSAPRTADVLRSIERRLDAAKREAVKANTDRPRRTK